MAIGFKNLNYMQPGGGIGGGQQPVQNGMMQPGMMQPNTQAMTKRPGMFGGKKWLGVLGDTLSIMGGGQPSFVPAMQRQRMMQQQAEAERAAQQEQRGYERDDWLFREQWKLKNSPNDPKDQLTRYMLAAGIDPASEQARAMYRAAAENAAYPVQGVPYTDEQGNSGIRFVRPNAPQSVPTAPVGKLKPIGGPASRAPGGF